MALGDRGAAESAQRIAHALTSDGIPYAIGGALALAIVGVPRGTADVDVNVFVGDDQVTRVIDPLRRLGIEIDPGSAIAAAQRDGMFVGRLERLVAVATPDFDHAYVRRWIVDMMGEGDERVSRWDEIVLRFAG